MVLLLLLHLFLVGALVIGFVVFEQRMENLIYNSLFQLAAVDFTKSF